MNGQERIVWATVFGVNVAKYTSMAEPPRAADLAVSLADEAVLMLRERADLGTFHNDEGLEAERRADLDLPDPTAVAMRARDVANEAGDAHEAQARDLRHTEPSGVAGMLAEERALACYQVADELEALYQSLLKHNPMAVAEYPELPVALAEAVRSIDAMRDRNTRLRESRRRWIAAIDAAVPGEGRWNTPDEATVVLRSLVLDSAELHRVARELGWSEAVNCPPWTFIEDELKRRAERA